MNAHILHIRKEMHDHNPSSRVHYFVQSKSLFRNGYGSTLPNMHGIEIPDPYGEFELRQRLGIATDMCYAIFGKPRANLKYQKSSIFDFRPSTGVFDVSNCRRSKMQRFYLPPLSTNGSAIRGAPGGVCWLAS